MKKSKILRMSEDQLKTHMQKNKNKSDDLKIDFLSDIQEEKITKKRKGTNVSAIMDTLKNPIIECKCIKGENKMILYMWFTGARVLTLNELFSILQVTKYKTYPYKTRWKELIDLALLQIPPKDRPYFDGPTEITLYRRGKKLIDLDSFPVAFKYAIDGLRKSNIISEDNPEIMVSTIPIQQKGKTTSIGLKIERLYDWNEDYKERNIHQEWFGYDEPEPPEVKKDFFE